MSSVTAKVVNAKGDIHWLCGLRKHRTDGPAVEWANGTKEWYQDDLRHRVDGPAVEYTDGRKEWWHHGRLHRVDGPAITDTNGNQWWYQTNLLHREDGPAVITNATCNDVRNIWGTFWYQNGKLHREDGPAWCDQHGTQAWYQNDVLERADGPAVVRADGSCFYSQSARDAGNPTIITSNGTRKWTNTRGDLHRENGPAVLYSGGAKYWYQNNRLHCTDGPAVEDDKDWGSDCKAWFINGKQLTEAEFNQRVKYV